MRLGGIAVRISIHHIRGKNSSIASIIRFSRDAITSNSALRQRTPCSRAPEGRSARERAAIDNGYGKIKNETFRIPHMADMVQTDLDDLFALLERLLPLARS